MKIVISIVAIILLCVSLDTAVADETRAGVVTGSTATPVQRATPTGKQATGAISAAPKKTRGAACCMKHCEAGSPHCGTGCTVVDSIGQCDPGANLKFECPANKGLSCSGSACSCQ